MTPFPYHIDIDSPIATTHVPISEDLVVFNTGEDDLDDVVLFHPLDDELTGTIHVMVLRP